MACGDEKSERLRSCSLRLFGLLRGADVNDVKTIIQRSVAANQEDWNVSPEYSYLERDRDPEGTKTYRVFHVAGLAIQRTGSGERPAALAPKSRKGSSKSWRRSPNKGRASHHNSGKSESGNIRRIVSGIT